jgi:hypothetical protein
MSTTAGLGSGEYVEVSGAAVCALLLGLGSGLAMLNDLLVIIPLAGIVVSIFALQQISASNGTQTGRGLVALAMVLMVAFGGWVGLRRVIQDVRTREDRQAISNVISQLAENAQAGKVNESYDLFSSRFQSNWKTTDFADRLKYLREAAVYGKLKSMDPGLMDFQADEATGAQFAVVRVNLNFEKLDRPLPDDLTFRKEGDHWRIEGFQTLFPPQAIRKPAGAPPS